MNNPTFTLPLARLATPIERARSPLIRRSMLSCVSPGGYVREQHFSFLFAQTFLRPAHVKKKFKLKIPIFKRTKEGFALLIAPI
ncbi:hypothetical protein FHG68_10240 [Leptospira weilii]|nr:hypothetical protein FHG68_10240 [Leptospira weilii]